ncbi:MAG: hypothetical protein HON32_04470 [Francisellaceae bacterium]|jgi:tRNA-modifying protein YgfZ|nr:hypothetical protein [Francisellaceae bacterium]MBT6539843.1 hypothetical protein [Francisellaceae bacterium]
MSNNQYEHIQSYINTIVAAHQQDSYRIICIEGANSEKFLQGQLSLDVSTVKDFNIQPGSYCEIKGRIESIFMLFKITDTFYMLIPKNNMQLTINELSKYSMLSRVSVKEYSDFINFQLTGIDIENIFKSTPTPGKLLETKYGYLYSSLSGGYGLLSKTNQQQSVLSLFEANNIELTKFDFSKTKKILSKFPEVYEKSRGLFLPHYIGAINKNLVNFSKGCFRGQEIIARMQYKTKIYKYEPIICTFDHNSTICEGDPVKSKDKTVGNIIIVDNEKGIALAMVAKNSLEVHTNDIHLEIIS